MVTRKKEGALTAHEKEIVKTLLDKGRRNQNIQALINFGRTATTNSARGSVEKSGWLVTCLRDLERGVEA